MLWTAEEIVQATRGRILRRGSERVFQGVVTDSREARKGSVFVALKGERSDGHAFVDDAARRGAACVVVHKAPRLGRLADVTVVQVRDTLEALGDLAHRRRVEGRPRVLAITGSNGKTTTKEMVAAILEEGSVAGVPLKGKVLKTEGNYNNLIGLPLTLLRLDKEEVAVVELGTNRPGEIGRLTEIADPDMGLITSVAPAHLEGLRSVAGVAREKGDLFRKMNPRGIAVVNLDDPWVRREGEKFRGEKVTYGKGGDVRVDSWKMAGTRGVEFTLRVGREKRRMRLGLFGQHNVANALAAAAMAYGFGVDLDAIEKGLARIKPCPMRMQLEERGGIKILNDAYNANPASMEAALRTLCEMNSKGRKFAVLGDMLELGAASPKKHLELGAKAARYRIDRLYLLGSEARLVREGALRGGMREEQAIIGRSHREIARMLRREIEPGDLLLIKGSRGMEMEKIVEALREVGA